MKDDLHRRPARQALPEPVRARRQLQRVAFYVAEQSEYSLRVHEGLLRYCDDNAGFFVRHFQDDVTLAGRTPALLAGPLPWAGWDPLGVIGIFPHGSEIERWIQRFNLPTISLQGDYRETIPTVHVSPSSIADLAIQHFLAMGYPNIAFVGVDGLVAVDQRRAALEQHLKDIGRPLLSYGFRQNPWPGLYTNEAAAASEPGLHRLLIDAPKPLGVLCTTDHAGRAVCLACEELGLDVPHEVGVLGIDNYVAGRACHPPLSSIHTPGEKVGYEAIRMVDRLINHLPVTTPLLVKASKLIARQSTGAGPGSPDSDVVRALAVIRDRACEGVGVEQILDHLPMSRSTLERQFMAMLGRTPGQEMLRVRLARARELLRNTTFPVSRIARMVGYERSSSFSEVFKKATGISPRVYRDGADGPSQSGSENI